jgi:hypothetical protein
MVRMKKLSRLARAVLIPLAALTILVASALPVNAAPLGSGPTSVVFHTLSMDW